MPESLQAKLAAARKRWLSLVAVGGLAASFAVLAALCLVSFHTDRWLALTTPGRLGWLIVLCVAPAVCALSLVLRPLLRPIPDESVAVEVERTFPALNERLLTTIELARVGAGAGVSGAMITQLASETERLSAPLDFVRAIPADRVRRPALFAGLGAVLLLGHVVLAPAAMATWLQRILHPAADIPLYAHTRVWVTPGDIVVPRGQDVEIGVTTRGTLPDRATLRYRFDDGKWAEASLAPDKTIQPPAGAEGAEAARTFRYRLADAQQSMTYYAKAGDGQANPHTIVVEDRPTILRVRLHLQYPAYTKRQPDTVTATAGNIVAPVGTQVQVEAVANKPLKSAVLMENGTPRADWSVRGETVLGHLRVAHDETYGLRLRDTHDFDASNPPQYTIRAEPDLPPQVQITKPGTDLDRAPGGSIGLRVTATDDYGVEETSLDYHVGKRSGSLPLPGANGAKQVAVGGVWNLAALHLRPGDTVSYEALARDGDTVPGPHTARSATYRLHILSVAEIRERLEARKAQEWEALKQLVQRQKEAQSDLAQALRDRRSDTAARAQGTQRSVAQETAELARTMQQTTQQIRDNGLTVASEERQRDATQRQLEQLAQKAMPAAADTIRRGSLPDAARQEQAIRQQLEQLAQQSSPTPNAFQLAQEAERLAQAQQHLADQAALKRAQMGEKSPAQMSAQERAELNAQARQQADLRAQTQALQQRLQQAGRSAEEHAQASASALRAAEQQMQAAGVGQKQTAAQRDLQAGRPEDASPRQNEAARDLQNLADKLDQAAMQERNAQEAQKRAADLDKLADTLMEMANQQARLSDKAQPGIDPQSARDLAQQEQRLHAQTEAISPQLSDVPQAQQGVHRAGENMQQASAQLNQNQGQAANSSAREAARQLYQAAQDARNASQAMQEAQATRQMQQRVEQLAREQRSLRQQTRQLDVARQRSNLSAQQQKDLQSRAQTLAQGQAGLEQRTQNLKPDMPSQSFQWALDQAGRRMEGATRALQQQNPGADTQRQQENAAQTLERIARALGQQAGGEQQRAEQQQSGEQSQGEQEMARAQGELQLAREMQAQIRQETSSVDQRRNLNPGHRPTAEQEREIESLTQAQRETQQIARRAADQLRSAQDIGKIVEGAADEMDDVRDRLRQQYTDAGTQGKQAHIVQTLDQALVKMRQAMRQQRQQMAQRQQQGQRSGQQQAQQMQQQGGNRPAPRTFAPVVQQHAPSVHGVNPDGRGFGALSPRAQQSLREGRQERVPAEYRDLVNQYYKALSERGK